MFAKTRYCPMCERDLPKSAFKVGQLVPKQWAAFISGSKYYSVCLQCLVNKVYTKTHPR